MKACCPLLSAVGQQESRAMRDCSLTRIGQFNSERREPRAQRSIEERSIEERPRDESLSDRHVQN